MIPLIKFIEIKSESSSGQQKSILFRNHFDDMLREHENEKEIKRNELINEMWRKILQCTDIVFVKLYMQINK